MHRLPVHSSRAGPAITSPSYFRLGGIVLTFVTFGIAKAAAAPRLLNAGSREQRRRVGSERQDLAVRSVVFFAPKIDAPTAWIDSYPVEERTGRRVTNLRITRGGSMTQRRSQRSCALSTALIDQARAAIVLGRHLTNETDPQPRRVHRPRTRSGVRCALSWLPPHFRFGVGNHSGVDIYERRFR